MILIVGCGFLGSYLAKHFSENSDKKIIALVRNDKDVLKLRNVTYFCGDVTDLTSLNKLASLCKSEMLTVYYFAAMHNVDYVYENPKVAEKVNLDALKSFFEVFSNIRNFYFASTDCVYGEGKSSLFKFSENSSLEPINEYGKQKAEAEKIVLSHGFTVLRLPFMLGPSLTDKKHFYDRIISDFQNGKKVEMIDGMERSVLSYGQVAEIMFNLHAEEAELPQVINIAADFVLSKYDIGCKLLEKSGIIDAEVEKITEADSSRFFKEKRASYVDMDNTLLKSILGLDKLEWNPDV